MHRLPPAFSSFFAQAEHRLRQLARLPLAADALIFAASLSLYTSTLSPSVYTFDSAELAAGVYSLGIVHATGYPVYLLLAKLFTLAVPVGDVAYRVNLFSAACAAFSLVALRRVMIALTDSLGSALAATAMFGASYPLWSEAVAAEVYTLHLLFVTGMIWLALRWRATGRPRFPILLALILGLSLGNHMSTVLVAPGLALLIWAGARRRPVSLSTWGLALLAAALGPLTYLYLPVRYAANPALNFALVLDVDLRTLDGIIWMARGAMFADWMFGYRLAEIPAQAIDFVVLLWQAFFGIGLIIAAIGVRELWRRDRSLSVALGLIFVVTAAFYINYRVFDKDTMFLPTFLIVSLWIAMGLRGLQDRLGRAGAAVGWGAVAVIAAMLFVNYPRVNLADNWTAREYAETVFRDVPPDSLVVGSWIDITPLEYLQVAEGKRPDVTLFDYGLYGLGRRAKLRAQSFDEENIRRITQLEIRRIVADALSAGRPVYALESSSLLGEQFSLAAEGQMFRVRQP